LKELTQHADLIVIGTVGSIVDEGQFLGYDKAGNRRDKDPDAPDVPPLTYVDYEIVVEQVLKGGEGHKTGNPVILRMPSKRTGPVEADAEYPMSAPGDHHLFFLTRNPDKKTYGLGYGAWSRLMIDGSVVRYSDGKRSPIDFTEAGTPDEFIKKVKDVAGQ
jgi:hypothetical protein